MKDKANERLLGIDLGTVRTGFAVSDPGRLLGLSHRNGNGTGSDPSG